MPATVRDLVYAADYSLDNDGPWREADLSGTDVILRFPGGLVGWTIEGGLAILLTNKTGANSVKGTIVEASTGTDDAFDLTGVDDNHPIGIVYEDGISDGSECWIVIYGRCQVLLEDTTAATHGNWVKTSGTAGRADATLAIPPTGGVAQLDEHMQEVGHCLESIAGGTDVLAYIMLHLN